VCLFIQAVYDRLSDVDIVDCEGRTKLEPISIVVLSVIMALASCQMILQGGTKIVEFIIFDVNHVDAVNLSQVVCVSIGNMSTYAVSDGPSVPEFLTDSIVICAVTIGPLLTEFYLYMRCCPVRALEHCPHYGLLR